MHIDDSVLVFSTDSGRITPEKNQVELPQGDGVVRIKRETKGRKGKGVMTINGLLLDEKALKVLMQLAIFLVLCKVSSYNKAYITLKLSALNSLVFTGGITKVLQEQDIQNIVEFFYKKILNSNHNPSIVMDFNYDIWTMALRQ